MQKEVAPAFFSAELKAKGCKDTYNENIAIIWAKGRTKVLE